MFEAGLGLIAACLPTLSYLFTHFSTQHIISSVRNALSRRSSHSDLPLRGKISYDIPVSGPYTKSQNNCSNTSTIVRDPRAVGDAENLFPEQIHAKYEVALSSNQMV